MLIRFTSHKRSPANVHLAQFFFIDGLLKKLNVNKPVSCILMSTKVCSNPFALTSRFLSSGCPGAALGGGGQVLPLRRLFILIKKTCMYKIAKLKHKRVEDCEHSVLEEIFIIT